MKPALKLLRLHNVDKGVRVDRPDERDQLPLGLRINDRVQHGFFFFLIAPDALKQGRIVVCSFFDRFIDFLRMIGYDKQSLLLITLIQQLNDLCAAELINDRVKCDLPAKQETGNTEDDHIACQNIVPGIDSLLF